MQPNIQITPALNPKIWGLPPGTTTALIPAKAGQKATNKPCPKCGGTGKFIHESCRSCSGSGTGQFIEVNRCLITDDNRAQWKTIIGGIRDLNAAGGRDEDTLAITPDPQFHHVQSTVELQETGGGLTNTGYATIICGMKGEMLTSHHGFAKCSEPHAIFHVFAALVVNYSHHYGNGRGSVRIVNVDRQNILVIEQCELWSFDDSLKCTELAPNKRLKSLNPPFEAIRAAISKSRCYHCRSAFYAIGQSANGPSGALTGAGAVNGGMPSPEKGSGIGYIPTN